MNNIRNKQTLSQLCVFLCFLIGLISCVYASKLPESVNEVKQRYCSFNGMLGDGKRWDEEFKMLEEPNDHPNFEAMSDMLSVFMTIPKNLVNDCPSLRKYLLALAGYHFDDTKIKKEVRKAIDYIRKNKL